jgi:hypothetical protein
MRTRVFVMWYLWGASTISEKPKRYSIVSVLGTNDYVESCLAQCKIYAGDYRPDQISFAHYKQVLCGMQSGYKFGPHTVRARKAVWRVFVGYAFPTSLIRSGYIFHCSLCKMSAPLIYKDH